MKTWALRVFGPPVANVTRPGVFETRTGSSGITRDRHFTVSFGSAAKPNCAMNPGITRKNAAPS